MSGSIDSHLDQFEDMAWELPPSHEKDSEMDHYYHYPGVTLGVHRKSDNRIDYERVRTHHFSSLLRRSTEYFRVKVPDLKKEQAVHLKIGQEVIIVTKPGTDFTGRNVYVSVLFYKNVSTSCNCGCRPMNVSHNQEALRSAEIAEPLTRKMMRKPRVHFAPLASVRYSKI